MGHAILPKTDTIWPHHRLQSADGSGRPTAGLGQHVDIRVVRDERPLQPHRRCLPETHGAVPAGEPFVSPSAHLHLDGNRAEDGSAVAGNRCRDAELVKLFLRRHSTPEEEGPVPCHQDGESNVLPPSLTRPRVDLASLGVITFLSYLLRVSANCRCEFQWLDGQITYQELLEQAIRDGV